MSFRVVVVSVLLVGCEQIAGLTGNFEDATGRRFAARVAALASLDHQIAEAVCARDAACGAEGGRAFWSREACVETLGSQEGYESFFSPVSVGTPRENLAKHYGPPASVSACVAAIARTPCDRATPRYLVPEMWPECRLVPVAPVHGGEPCGAADAVCDIGLECTSDPCRVCAKPAVRTPLGEGADCSGGGACNPPLACLYDGTTLHCEIVPTEGQPCYDRCVGDFACIENPITSQGTCRRRASAGEPCDDTSCMLDLACASITHRCEPYQLERQPCPRKTDVGGKGCIQGEFCVFAKPDAVDGVCTLSPARQGPTPCSRDHSGMSCPYDTYIDTHGMSLLELSQASLSYCECLPLVAPGGTCQDASECDTRRCIAGTCRARLPSGERCVEDNDCITEHCVLGACNGTQAAGRRCKADTDCISGHCDATERCQGPDDACAP